jgi:predicted TIM-barrel fold metal-dependent hydrolase
MKALVRLAGILLLGALAAARAQQPLPVIDMHLHANPYDAEGPPPMAMCTPMQLPVWDQRESYEETYLRLFKEPACDDPVWSPTSDEELMQRTLEEMRSRNVYGVVSGPLENVDRWVAEEPNRIFRGLIFSIGPDMPSPGGLVELHENGRLDVLAEITTQYQGIHPADERLEPYWAMLEENDIPAGIHVGTGPPGVIYLGAERYRGRLHSALTMEEVLAKHPKLRVFLGHAGFPMIDDTLALLYAHPQVYVGVGVIVYTQPRKAFYSFLKKLVDAGFGKRILFGSDQMSWPETIGRSIDVINEAPFLSEEEKRDILFNNAARFLRLSDQEIAGMYGEGEK